MCWIYELCNRHSDTIALLSTQLTSSFVCSVLKCIAYICNIHSMSFQKFRSPIKKSDLIRIKAQLCESFMASHKANDLIRIWGCIYQRNVMERLERIFFRSVPVNGRLFKGSSLLHVRVWRAYSDCVFFNYCYWKWLE